MADPASLPTEKDALAQAIRSGADFSKAVFNKLDFSDLELEGVDLAGAHFKECIFARTNLSRSKLAGCNFVDCDFNDYASLLCADMKGSTFDRCLFTKHCNAVGARLLSAKFSQCHFEHFSFEEAMLEKAELSDCYMREISFRAADARGARFRRINLFMPEGVERPKRSRNGCVWGFGLSFHGTVLHDASFDLCDFEGTNFVTYHGSLRSMTRCHLYGGRFYELEREPNVDQATLDSNFSSYNPCQRALAQAAPSATLSPAPAQVEYLKPAEPRRALPRVDTGGPSAILQVYADPAQGPG